MWKAEYSLNLQTIESLIDGKIGAIVVDDFYSLSDCRAIVSNTKAYPFSGSYDASNTIAAFHGQAAVELQFEKEKYFEAASREWDKMGKIVEAVDTSPLQSVIRSLAGVWPGGAEVAHESGRKYFAGIIRSFKTGVLHNDYAPRSMKGWSVESIKHQLSWNIYLSEDVKGGDLEVWNKLWVPEHQDLYKNKGTSVKGYSPDVVSGCESFRFAPKVGSLVIINATNYHKVHEVLGNSERFAVSSFVGVREQKQPLVLWS